MFDVKEMLSFMRKTGRTVRPFTAPLTNAALIVPYSEERIALAFPAGGSPYYLGITPDVTATTGFKIATDGGWITLDIWHYGSLVFGPIFSLATGSQVQSACLEVFGPP